MKKYLPVLMAGLLAVGIPFADAKSKTLQADGQNSTQELVKDISEFSTALYSTVDSSVNFVFSPYSIYSCLALVYGGARNETASQMQTAMSLDINQKQLPKAYAQLSKQLRPQKGEPVAYEFNMANGLWLDIDTFILSDFRHAAENDYDAKIETLDFGKTDEAMTSVNEWVQNATKGKINRLLEPGDVDGSTRVLVTNAVYFKGSWQNPFDIRKTKPGSFFIADGTTEVKMMDNLAMLPYFENDTMQIAALPFKGKTIENGRLACLILLPKEKNFLHSLDNSLTTANLQNWMSQLREENVHIKLPKFQLTQRLDLNQTLQGLGMEKAFTDEADFSGIDGMQDLFLSKVVHETFFSIDEAGVTAAAATSASMNMKGFFPKQPPIAFIADHPFVFMIVDLNTKTPLFMGRFVNP